VFVSPAFERIFGYRPEEVVGRRMLDMVHPEDLGVTSSQAESVMDGDLQLQFENRYVRKDGGIAHIRWTARWLPERHVRLAVAHDITERKVHEGKQAAIYAISEAAHAAQTLESLFQRIHEIIGGLLVATNFSVLLREGDSEALRCAYHANGHSPAQDTPSLETDVRSAHVFRTGKPLLLTPEASQAGPELNLLQLAQALPTPLYWLGVPLQSQNEVMGVLVLQSDTDQGQYTEKDKELLQFVSAQVATAIERKQMQERLEHLAQFDALTQLPNRTLLLDRLQGALARADRESMHVSLLFIDLDDFKQVNDTLGHGMGDLLLQQVAQRLLACVRASDTVARLGGDEFVVLLERGHNKDHAGSVAQKILGVFEAAFDLRGHPVHIHPSIGTALCPEHGCDAQQLLSQADRAMYQSKQRGGNQVHSALAQGVGQSEPN
ncbi:MAG: diguanylate cyclase domain-containing protein, partial [Giesbergeria sp.]